MPRSSAVAGTHVVACSIGLLAASPTSVRAETSSDVDLLVPGEIAPLPPKGRLPRRETLAVLTVGGGALLEDGAAGGEVFTAFRFAEGLGAGVGVSTTSDGEALFVRLDAIGLVINHWAFLGFADYAVSAGWRVGGAAVAPLRRDTYLRVSVVRGVEGDPALGLGMEYDLW